MSCTAAAAVAATSDVACCCNLNVAFSCAPANVAVGTSRQFRPSFVSASSPYPLPLPCSPLPSPPLPLQRRGGDGVLGARVGRAAGPPGGPQLLEARRARRAWWPGPWRARWRPRRRPRWRRRPQAQPRRRRWRPCCKARQRWRRPRRLNAACACAAVELMQPTLQVVLLGWLEACLSD